MGKITASEAAKAVVRRNTEEVQGKGNFAVFEELFADDFVDHTPQPDVNNCEMEPPGHKRGSPLLERRRGVARSL